MTRPRTGLYLLLAATALPSLSAQQPTAGVLPAEWVSSLEWRAVGPTGMSGRIVTYSVLENDPHTYWVGTAAGGVLKTTDNGQTFEHQFDHENTYAIGDIQHAPSNPDIVWVGTGEQNPIRSLSYGDGVYKSTDGGTTWTHKGLKESFMIGRIAIHPTNPDIVYVGAQGRLYGPNEQRGLYKTTDGGNNWTKILHIDEKTGVIDVKMHPNDPDTLLIVTYERQRDAYDGGTIPHATGPGAGLYKTTDGGQNFREITAGLPTSDWDRTGVSYCQSNPQVVYAVVAAAERSETGVYRSADGGESWTKGANNAGSPHYYYGKIYADPVDENRVYVLSVSSVVSTDGGQTFGPIGRGPHADNHAMWINPENNRHILLGNDGGNYVSYNQAQSWEHMNNVDIATFYHVAVDTQPIYWIYGGLQDNGTWAGPNRTRSGGVTNEDWVNVGGGDGFVTFAHPDKPYIVWSESQGGSMSRRDMRTNQTTRLSPPQVEGQGRPRMNWKTPMILSNHGNHNVFYTAGNVVYRSESLGDDLVQISEELTLTNRGAATAIAEDHYDANTLYVGTEDGALHVTRNLGESWEEIHARLPVEGPRWVATIETSKFARGRVYVTLDAHRSDDDNPYVMVSEDYGQNWTDITSNLPWGSSRTLREDAESPNVLYVGHEFGVYASLDRGTSWTKINNNLPTVSTHEIAVHPTAGEIVAGTHGRSFWILDVTAIRQMSRATVSAASHLYEPAPLVRWRSQPRRSRKGLNGFVGGVPAAGTPIYYSLARDASSVSLEIKDRSNTTIRTIPAPSTAGLHKVNWNGSANPPVGQATGAAARRGGQRGRGGAARGGRGGAARGGRGGAARGGRGGAARGGRGGRGGGGGGAAVPFGEYTVVLTVDGRQHTTKVQVVDDPEPIK